MAVLNGGYLVQLLFISLLDLFKKATKKMNIKPVGHFYPEGEGATVYDIKFAWKVTGTTEPIPLYTHPANELAEDLEGAKLVVLRLQAEIEALKAEKIRAYDNGYEDGRKPNTNKAQEK